MINQFWVNASEDIPYWSESAKEGDPATIQDLEVIFARIVSVVAAFAGIAALFMLIAGGFRFLTSGGDPKATAAARSTITYAIIGLVLLVGVWLVLKILETFTGVPLTQFIIYREES